jgi:hypothetical protein
MNIGVAIRPSAQTQMVRTTHTERVHWTRWQLARDKVSNLVADSMGHNRGSGREDKTHLATRNHEWRRNSLASNLVS